MKLDVLSRLAEHFCGGKDTAPITSRGGGSLRPRRRRVYCSDEVEVRGPRDVDLEICRGKSVVLLGAFGSGKSTLLDFLDGLDVRRTPEYALPNIC